MRIGARGIIVGVLLFASILATVGHWLSPRVGRDSARYAFDTLRNFPWLTDSYSFEPADLARQDLDGAGIESLSNSLFDQYTKAFLILQNGRLVHERYARFHSADVRYHTASLAKAVVASMVLLLALDATRIDLGDLAWRYIADWQDDALRSVITIRDLANHSSGIEDAKEGGRSGVQLAGWKGDYWRHQAKRFDIALSVAPITFYPGTAVAYSNPGYTALSFALSESLRGAPVADPEELLRMRLMEPLGVPDTHWSIGYGTRFQRDGLSLYLLEGGGRYTARALGRLGQLIASGGRWNEKSLISPRLVESLIAGQLATPANRPSWKPVPVLGWWSNVECTWRHLPKDTLVGAGAGHQVVIVIPSHSLVVVRQGGSLGGPGSGKGYWRVLEEAMLRPLAEIIRPEIGEESKLLSRVEFGLSNLPDTANVPTCQPAGAILSRDSHN